MKFANVAEKKIHNWPLTWVSAIVATFSPYMAKILSIRCKTLSNQSTFPHEVTKKTPYCLNETYIYVRQGLINSRLVRSREFRATDTKMTSTFIHSIVLKNINN